MTADGTIEPEAGRVFTTLTFDAPLAHAYVPSTVRVNGNTVLATHGESKSEVLGGGNASSRFQTFTLKQPPLTYTSAPTPTGGKSSLQVRVDDVLWDEAEMLFGLRSDDRRYIVRIDDDGTTRVLFNAPLPSGTENVRASYRSGIGLAGRVKADQLTLLSSRPLGVRGVTNPLPAAGGEDREDAESLRRGASLPSLTLGRLVSLRDYEDFARGFSGFAKAHATVASDGERLAIFVTVAPAGGGTILETSETFGNLRSAMAAFGDPHVAFRVQPWRPAFFQVAAHVGIGADRDPAIRVLRNPGTAARCVLVRATVVRPGRRRERGDRQHPVRSRCRLRRSRLPVEDRSTGRGYDRAGPAAARSPRLGRSRARDPHRRRAAGGDPDARSPAHVDHRVEGATMTTPEEDRLWALLPAIYRVRDQQMGGPLKGLVGVIARETAVVQEGIEQAYDDLFIETCAEWVVPYIGELIGARLPRLPADAAVGQRAQVANTLGLRRRKGTLAAVEEIARDVMQWPVVAVEFFRRLAVTQYAKHVRADNVVTVDFRDRAGLDAVDTAFDRAAHTFEARRIVTGRGRYNIPNIGLFVFRLRALPLRRVTASRVDGRRYRFDPLGIDQPLFTLPDPERSVAELAQPINVPLPIGRLAMQADRDGYYGRSLSVEVGGTRIDPAEVTVCNLADDTAGGWTHAPADRYGIDPVLGRLALPANAAEPTAGTVLVTYHYGGPDAIGGGAYDREPPAMDESRRAVSGGSGLQAALSAAGTTPVIEFADSRTYDIAAGTPNLALPGGTNAIVAAADGERPLIRVSGGDPLIDAEDRAALTLSGLVFVGGTVRVIGALDRLTIEHCTFVPGVARTAANLPAQQGTASLVVESPAARVTIASSVLGPLRVALGARVSVTNSIVDAGDAGEVAYAATGAGLSFGGELALERCTVVGQVRTQHLQASSSTSSRARPAARRRCTPRRRSRGASAIRTCRWPPGRQAATGASRPHRTRPCGRCSPRSASACRATPSSRRTARAKSSRAGKMTAKWASSTTCIGATARPTSGCASRSTCASDSKRESSTQANRGGMCAS